VATLLLADLGADVIKIEDPNGGDYARWTPPLHDGLGVVFRVINRSKRSVILDLKHPDGLAVLRTLAASADVLIESFRPGVMQRLGADYAALRDVNPRLIYCALSGWGADGPYALRSGHDLNYAATAGLLGGMGQPQPFGGQVADIGGAYVAVIGVLAALLRRGAGGAGAFVDASLFEGSLPFGLYNWAEALKTGRGGGDGSLTGGAACYNIYAARDGRAVALAALEPKFWANFCAAVERPDLLPDHLLPERQSYLRAELAEIFALRSADDWRALLEPADCCFSLVIAPADVAADAQIQARGLMGSGDDGAPWLRSPVRLDGLPFALGSVPGYGEHTRAVLQEAGYDAQTVERLLAAGAAVGP
jgi:crotonobetainyl-CoA:carnitine CoA-transferase CaiB-like acyl-CoA transferase